jgi:hypothetical protein
MVEQKANTITMTLEASFTPLVAIMQKYNEKVVASMCCNFHKIKVNMHGETQHFSLNLER